ncbi:unnamed protein product [Blepharisma stoltei]|uniref:Uncharacterized protein n=1 Tax=Blepharisma stoltei TaxID=1481888 RepID=A0AAU9J7P2_9CILI|nr:unnamed protein product [Blepharisma stoltei]
MHICYTAQIHNRTMDSDINNLYWAFPQYTQNLPKFDELPQGCVWVPCIPDFTTNTYIPIYNLHAQIHLPSNTKTQACKSEKIKISRGGIKTLPWKESEDKLLQDLVELHGLKKWSLISQEINKALYDGNEMRKGKHCRERWHNHLDPGLNKGEWSYEEDIYLLQLKEQYGNRWSLISKGLQGRNENSVKNRWNCLIKRARQDPEMQYYSSDTITAILIKELQEQRSQTNN